MTSMELFDILGTARDSYVQEVQRIRTGACTAKTKKPSRRRLLLIAAIVALTLLLVGCAVVYVLRLQDMKVGEYSIYIPTIYDEDGNVVPVEAPARPTTFWCRRLAKPAAWIFGNLCCWAIPA